MPSARSPKPGAMIAPGCAMQLLGHERLGGQQQRRHRRRVLERQPRDPHRVDHALLEQVAELAGRARSGRGPRASRAPGRSSPARRSRRWRRSSTAARRARSGRSPRHARSRRRARAPSSAPRRRAATRYRRPGRLPRTSPPASPPASPRCAGSAPSTRRSDGAPTRITARFAESRAIRSCRISMSRSWTARASSDPQLRQPALDRLGRAAALDERALVRGGDHARAPCRSARASRRRATARPPRRSRCRRRTRRGRRDAGCAGARSPGARTATASASRARCWARACPSALRLGRSRTGSPAAAARCRPR